MQEQLISFEVAKLAKEKGFDIPVDTYLTEKNKDINRKLKMRVPLCNFNQINNIFSRPTQSLLQKWLREMHKINVESNYLPNIQKYRCLFVPMTKSISIKEKYSLKSKYYGIENFDTYEEALEAGLQEALKLIKNEKGEI